MNLLLTGGAGYVGSACLRWLLKHGHDPIAYDNLRDGNADAVPPDRLVVGDILDTARLTSVLRDHSIDAVLHFAAVASVPDSINDPQNYWRINLGGTRSVLDAMLQANVTRLLFSSTAATYSFDSPMPLDEDSMQAPRVPYGTSKLAAEWIIKDYAKAYGLGYTILRYFNASGADSDGTHGEHRRRESHLIPLVLYTALGQREKLYVYGSDWPTPDGTCVRDFVHIEDLALAHQLAVESLQPKMGRVYNIGSGQGVTVKQVLDAAEHVVGRPIPHDLVDRRPGDPAVLVAGSERLKRELGWQPRFTDIEEIVASAWRWHQHHPDGYGPHRPLSDFA